MKRLVCLLLPLCLLCGCRPKTEVGDQIVVTGIALDSRDGRYRVSVQAVEQSDPATATYTASGDTVAQALQGFLNEAGKRTYILQNRILVLGREHCQRTSLFDTLDYFIRTQEGQATVQLAVCRGDPSALLSVDGGSDAIPADYVSQLLQEGYRTTRCVSACLLDVERSLSGMYDAALPILEVSDGTPRLSGTALFRDGRLVGELTDRQTRGLLLANGDSDRCVYTVNGTALELEEQHTSVAVTPTQTGWHYRITLTAASSVREVGTPYSEALLRRAEAELAADIEEAMHAIIACRSDPLGLARRTAARYCRRGITQDAAREALPRATFTAEVTLTSTDRGFLP